MNGTLRQIFAGITICGVLGGCFAWGRSLRGNASTLLPTAAASPAHSRRFAKAGTTPDDAFSPAEKDPPAEPADVFDEALQRIQNDFALSSPDTQILTDAMLSHLTAAIKDPATRYYPFRQDSLRRAQLLGYYEGLGANLATTRTKQDEIARLVLTVQSVLAGSPAEAAGLKSGDNIREINGHWIVGTLMPDTFPTQFDGSEEQFAPNADLSKVPRGLSLSAARTLLNTGKDTTLKLTVERSGQPKPLTVEVRTAKTISPAADFQWEDKERGIGRLAIHRFNRFTADFVGNVREKYGSAIHGLIVDLRQCSGGVQTGVVYPEANGLSALTETLAYLTGSGTIAILETRPHKQESLAIDSKVGKPNFPLVVLADKGTANLGEAAAAALRDLGKAKIIGVPTFGDATLLYHAGVSSGSLEIASARLLTANGKSLEKGVTPDIAATPENALEQAILLLTKERKSAQ